MRKIAFLLLWVAAFAVATGQKEAIAPMEISVLWGGTQGPIPPDYTGDRHGQTQTMDFLFAWFAETYPNVTFKKLQIDLSTGSTMTMDAMLAAGNAPDIYWDMDGRVAKYMVPEFALPLENYLSKELLADLYPTMLAQVTRGGHVYAVPGGVAGVGLCVNTSLLDEAGYKMPAPKDWTIDEFTKMAKAVKAKRPDAYATYLFAKDQSSDQWWMWWFYAFGAAVYKPGDYSKTTINSPQAREALAYLKYLVDNDLAPREAATWDDGKAVDYWGRGLIAAGAMQTAHTLAMDSALKQGTLKKPFNFFFTCFPRAATVAKVPVVAYYSLALAKKSKDDRRNKAAAYWLELFSSKDNQLMQGIIPGGGYPSRQSLVVKSQDPLYDQLFKVLQEYGSIDLGRTNPPFSAVRAQMYPLLQKFYMGKMTADAVLVEYEKNVNKILAEGK